MDQRAERAAIQTVNIPALPQLQRKVAPQLLQWGWGVRNPLQAVVLGVEMPQPHPSSAAERWGLRAALDFRCHFPLEHHLWFASWAI